MNHPKEGTLKKAIVECRRFIRAGEIALEATADDAMKWYGSKETGAAHRASMDATRALASYRRGREG